MPDADDELASKPARPVTSMTLRAERLRRQFAQAAGAKVDSADPGLSVAPTPRDPELTNVFAVIGFVAGIVAIFLDFFFVPTVVAAVFCVLALRRAHELDARGKGPFGRRRALWGFGLAGFGALGILFQLFVRPLF